MSGFHHSQAIEDFRSARQKAHMRDIVARLTGHSDDLLSFDEVRENLKAVQTPKSTLENIPLDKIVGSVGRYHDFTRDFLPRDSVDKDRWARVKTIIDGDIGVAPIEVYQIGQVYFVLDGNHRVSIARQEGTATIQAYVTEYKTSVLLSPDDQPDDLIIKSEYAAFLERTHLDRSRPDADFSVTCAGRYKELEEHIAVHRYFMGIEQEREIPYEDAVAHWFDTFYLPVVDLIREKGILRDFPGRTETDLYIWALKYRDELKGALGWDIETQEAIDDLAAKSSPKPIRVASRMGSKVLDTLTPDALEAGPAPGMWRQQRLEARDDARLFTDILVSIESQQSSWSALDQALFVAQLEGASVHGLHVASVDQEVDESIQPMEAEFYQRCEAAGVSGTFAVERGQTARKICERSRWVDLMVLKLSHPPSPGPVARLGSGFRTLIRRCPRPILAVPAEPSRLQNVLLAYDGSPKAQEALFISAYLGGRCQSRLFVITVGQKIFSSTTILEGVREYLESYAIQAFYIEKDGGVAESILASAEEHACDLILMGGYGSPPVTEVLLGSSVDQVLRQSTHPILVCR